MKNRFLFFILLIAGLPALSQNNTFPVPSGNTGVGISTPDFKFEVAGTSASKQSVITINKNLFLQADNTNHLATNAYVDLGSWQIPNASLRSSLIELSNNGRIDFYGTTTAGLSDWKQMAVFDAPAGKAYFPNGFIGIGTDNPGGKLDIVNGTTRLLFGANDNGLGDVLRIAGANGFNFSVNSYTPTSTSLITDLGVNYAIDGGNGGQAYALAGTKKSPMIRLNAEDGSINLYGESGSGGDYRVPALNLALSVRPNGNVGVGTDAPGDFKMAVEGKLGARKIVVKQTSWADYVLDPNYRLLPLKQLESFIQINRHLPGIVTEKEVLEKGLDLGNNQEALLKKIEELTLYIIEQDKAVSDLKKELAEIKTMLQSLR